MTAHPHSPDQGPERKRPMREKLLKAARWVPTGIAVFCILAFIAQNTQSVETRFLFFRFVAPRAGLIAISFGLGVVTGILILLTYRRKAS